MLRLVYKNYIWNIFGFVLPMSAFVYSTPKALELFNVQLFAIVSIAWILISYFSISDFGINKALLHKIASLEKNDIVFQENITSSMIINFFIASIIIIVISINLNYFSSLIYKNNVSLKIYADQLLFFSCFAIIPILISSSFRAILESQNNFLEVNIGKSIGLSGLYLFPIVTYVFTKNFSYSLLSIFASKIIQLIIYFWFCLRKKLITSSLFKIPSRKIIISLLIFGGWLSIVLLIGSLIVYIDKLFLIKNFSYAEIALYNTIFESITKIVFLSTSMSIALFPLFSKYKDQKKEMVKIKKNANTLILIINLIVIIILYWSGDLFLKFWLTEKYTPKHYEIALILSVGVAFNSFAQIHVAAIIADRKEKILAKFYAIELIFYIFSLYIVLLTIKSLTLLALIWSLRAGVDFILVLILDKNT